MLAAVGSMFAVGGSMVHQLCNLHRPSYSHSDINGP